MNANSRNESVILSNICMRDVNEHYHNREENHKRLKGYLTDKAISKYVKLAVGVDDPLGNYSAYEHGLGELILHYNSEQAIFNLAQDLYKCSDYKKIPDVIKAHNLMYIKISVGTEMAMMLCPNDFWVANVRTIWAHF